MDGLQAVQLCFNSTETFGQTNPRKSRGSLDQESKKQRSSNDITGFLRGKSAQESKFCQQEPYLKRQGMQNFQSLMANSQ